MSNLVRHSGDLMARTRDLATLSDEDLKRFAAQAARDRDIEALWALTEAHLTLHGAAGSRVSVRTLEGYERYGRKLVEAWSSEALLRPSRNAGVLWVRDLEARYKPATVGVNVAAARALYAALRWSGASESDPFSDVKPAKDLTPAWEKREAYSHSELEMLLKVADGYTLYIVYLGAHAGLRVSEMLSVRWKDASLTNKKLKVTGKGGKVGTVYLSQSLVKLLEAVPEEERQGYLLSSCRNRQGVYKRLESACRRARVKFKGVHALRHSAGTRMLNETGNLVLVAEHLRHASVNTARGYAHQDNRALKKAVGEW